MHNNLHGVSSSHLTSAPVVTQVAYTAAGSVEENQRVRRKLPAPPSDEDEEKEYLRKCLRERQELIKARNRKSDKPANRLPEVPTIDSSDTTTKIKKMSMKLCAFR